MTSDKHTILFVWTIVLGFSALDSRSATIDLDAVRQSPGAVLTANGPAPASVTLTRRWEGGLCRSEVVNSGDQPVRIKEVILFKIPHGFPPETLLYGEGFQMLSQTGGTLGKPVNFSGLTDRKH